MDIQWYPGHMAKAIRILKNDLKLTNLMVEMVDARAPLSSRNPEIVKIAKNKRRILVLNKADLADDLLTRCWIEEFKKMGENVLAINSKIPNGSKCLMIKFKQYADEYNSKRLYKKAFKIMVVGIPNVGKSLLINQLAKCSKAKIADRPGVTRAKQWVDLGKEIKLLDTPGVLWPKFENTDIGVKLALIRSIKDELADPINLSFKLIDILKENYPQAIIERYKLTSIPEKPQEIIEAIGMKRGCILSKGNIDEERAAKMLIDDFRQGNLGKISLERP